jgi:hypothetical protein
MSVDITSAEFQVPVSAVAPVSQMYASVAPVDITALTTGVINGTGAFDLIMAAVSAQLLNEFNNNRITGGEYTKAYIEATQAALQTALQFVLGANQAFWQAQNQQIAAVTGMVSLETARYNYDTTLPLETNTLSIQSSAAAFNLANTLPAQLTNIEAQFTLITNQSEVQHAQVSDFRLDGLTPITGVMGSQEALYKQQIISYQRDAEVKAAKIFSDTWITQKTIDSGLLAPNCFDNNTTNQIMAVIMANNTFGTPIP